MATLRNDVRQQNGAPSMSSLVGGIIDDAQRLIRQEIALARREMQEEMNKAKVAALSFGAAAAVGLLGAVLTGFTLAHLIHWAAGASDPSAIPLWACYAIVMALFFAAAAVLFFMAKSKATEIHLVPRQTVDSLRENVKWLKNQT
jgi:hypothetical protein